MRRFVLLAPLVLLAALSVGAAPVSGSQEGDFASVKGTATFTFSGVNSEVWISAVQTRSGSANGRIEQTDAGFGTTVTQVTCIRPSQLPDSSRVAVGGIILSSYAQPMIGESVWYIVDDLGAGGGAPFDRLSIGVGDTASACPYDPGLIAGDLDYVATAGDFVVKSH